MNKPALFNKEFQKQQSDQYKYKHIHTGEYCTFEAYLAELIVLRRAERLNLERPSYKFWTKGDPNHWLWMKQMNAARALKKKYSEEAILSAINSDDFKKLLLIGLQNGRGWKLNPSVVPIIERHQKMLDEAKAKQSTSFVEIPNEPVVRKAKLGNAKSIMNRLRGKDGEKSS